MSTPQFENIDVDAVHEEEAEAQREEMRERSEGQRLANKIAQSREQKTLHVRVAGKRVPFSPIGGRMDEVEDMMGEFADKDDPEQLTGEEFERYQQLRATVDEILGEKCKLSDPDTGVFTAEWWSDKFTSEERQEFLASLASGGIEGGDAAEFRQD